MKTIPIATVNAAKVPLTFALPKTSRTRITEEAARVLAQHGRPTVTGKPQRGAVKGAALRKKPTKRLGEKRLTLALDGETYNRLRGHAAETDQTHQAILKVALTEYLKRANA